LLNFFAGILAVTDLQFYLLSVIRASALISSADLSGPHGYCGTIQLFDFSSR
jgi:hypothetical protein